MDFLKDKGIDEKATGMNIVYYFKNQNRRNHGN